MFPAPKLEAVAFKGNCTSPSEGFDKVSPGSYKCRHPLPVGKEMHCEKSLVHTGISNVFACFCFLDRAMLCSPGKLGAPCVYLTGFEPMPFLLFQLPKC